MRMSGVFPCLAVQFFLLAVISPDAEATSSHADSLARIQYTAWSSADSRNATLPSIGAGPGVSSLQSGRSQDRGARRFGHLDLTNGKNNPDAAGVITIPHWSDSFTYNGLVYNYTMVGTDPKKGSTTTVIPTVLIPLRFVFADGSVFDATTDIVNGQTPVQGIINSPIFQDYDFDSTRAKVGKTQFGDAFQRANFWSSVSTRAPNYHVVLGQPTVLPVQTINVPYGSFDYYNDPVFGPQPLVDDRVLFDLVGSTLATAHVSPSALPIIVWGTITGFSSFAVHGVANVNGRDPQTFIATTYLPGAFFDFPGIISGVFFSDVYPLSHEIAEWMDDPFGNNFTPGWDIAFLLPGQNAYSTRCDSGLSGFLGPWDLMEVADPVELWVQSDVPLPNPTYTYHVTEAVFIDWFTRAPRSRSYNGQYAMFEIGLTLSGFERITPPTAICTGHVEFKPTFVDFPGAAFTVVSGINSSGTAVGFYDDFVGGQHGFVLSGSRYSTLDYPGSLLSGAYKINDAGIIVGSFVDASLVSHGYSYANGEWTQIDFPNAADTEAYGINAAGDVVGTYDASQPVTHAFLVRNGSYQEIDTPFGTQANALAINDAGAIAGLSYTDPSGVATGFIDLHGRFASFQFPGSVATVPYSINDSNDLAGALVDPDGSFWGMVTVSGIPYQVNAAILGNDNFDRICGYAFDDTGTPRGFIGTLPLVRTAH